MVWLMVMTWLMMAWLLSHRLLMTWLMMAWL
jgi:hypothetical protein